MRTIKLILVIVIALALMLVMAANWAPVDLYLVPKSVGADALSLKDVPLALVIVLAASIGLILGFLIEFLRESKFRSMLNEKRAEIGRLKSENARLAKHAGVDPDELSLMAS
ncbi:MAG: LapA family protein [Pseudomonadota bacterium]